MLGAILMGGIAAAIVTASELLQKFVEGHWTHFAWTPPVLLLAITGTAVLLQRFGVERSQASRSYDGIADLFIHIHSPSSPDSIIRWGSRGIISFLFSIGGWIGPEGAAIEVCHGAGIKYRPRSSKWFEQRRRTDVATSLSSGISAAFGAPFAGVLLPLEFGAGGRSMLAVVSAFTSFFATRFLNGLLNLDRPDFAGLAYGFNFLHWQKWLGLVAVSISAGIMGVFVIRFVRYCQESLLEIFQTQTWMRILAGGVLLFLVVLVYRSGPTSPASFLHEILWSNKTVLQAGTYFLYQLLSIALIVAAFGTAGLFWPIFVLGGILGFFINHWILVGMAGFTAAAGLVGGVAFWGAVLGVPFSGSILGFELTQNYSVLLPCFIAGWIAREVRKGLGGQSLIERDLAARGVSLANGRASAILESISVKDAMITDFEAIHEQEPVSQIYTRLMNSRYPFLPVVNSQKIYIGMLTVDMVQDAWKKQRTSGSLSELLEAKDLLYRARLNIPTVKSGDRLSAVTGLFEDMPCLPVLTEDRRVSGLLFAYSVRQAYDREAVRRSLVFEDHEV